MDDADRGKPATIYIVAYLPYDKLLVSSDQELFLTQHFTNPVLVIKNHIIIRSPIDCLGIANKRTFIMLTYR